MVRGLAPGWHSKRPLASFSCTALCGLAPVLESSAYWLGLGLGLRLGLAFGLGLGLGFGLRLGLGLGKGVGLG